MRLKKINYESLNSRQKENYNFQRISAVLADYGFVTIRLSDDWNGADFLALHKDGKTLRVQLKGRLSFSKKYVGKNLWICFRVKDDWYFYPHDKLMKKIVIGTAIEKCNTWKHRGLRTVPKLSAEHKRILNQYKL